MEEYEKLLDNAYLKVKKVVGSGERFEVPKVEGRFLGKKTLITNFFSIASHLRRDSEHFQKYLLKELAAAGVVEGERLVLNKKVPSAKINLKIEQYAKEFVVCRECKKPDTELVKEGRLTYLHCLACGAKHAI
jgi:translation initiation factor 2 subunit 2